ncbi:MAG: hypothetical protein LBE31_11125 [Deltaproteobacteria bacterium]|nr:hypothetical protein [Deltaproteobacteria bacterium]
MDLSDHDKLLIIKFFCRKIQEAATTYGRDFSSLTGNFHYISLLSMYLIQIGGQCEKLTDEFKEINSEISWSVLIDFKNKLITSFFSSDIVDIWNLSGECAIKLFGLCREKLGDEEFSFPSFLN